MEAPKDRGRRGVRLPPPRRRTWRREGGRRAAATGATAMATAVTEGRGRQGGLGRVLSFAHGTLVFAFVSARGFYNRRRETKPPALETVVRHESVNYSFTVARVPPTAQRTRALQTTGCSHTLRSNRPSWGRKWRVFGTSPTLTDALMASSTSVLRLCCAPTVLTIRNRSVPTGSTTPHRVHFTGARTARG
jgi:hypothetical protein